MILPDVNLLVYAHNTAAPEHLRAKLWWETTINSGVSILIPTAVALGFMRIITNRKILMQPLGPQAALVLVADWFAAPNVRLLEATKAHWMDLETVLNSTSWTGPAISDAHLAALAMGNNAVLHSNDNDFGRVPNLQWVNPLMP